MSKVAVVTGAGTGIGRACAIALMQEDWNVVLVGRKIDSLQSVIDSAGVKSGTGIAVAADVTNEEDVNSLFMHVHEQYGRLDLLFNNAGVFLPYDLVGDVDFKAWRRCVDVNLNGAFYCLSRAFRMMQTQLPQGGRIINNGSISSHVPRPGSIAYTATKHAITGLTKAAALDGRPFGIAVGQIDIGNVTSDMTTLMSSGAVQADLSVRPEPCMEMTSVVETFMTMVRLPLSANILFTTVMATNMPYVGRG